MSALESDKRSSENQMCIERSSDQFLTQVKPDAKPDADSHTTNESALKEFSDENRTNVFKFETKSVNQCH